MIRIDFDQANTTEKEAFAALRPTGGVLVTNFHATMEGLYHPPEVDGFMVTPTGCVAIEVKGTPKAGPLHSPANGGWRVGQATKPFNKDGENPGNQAMKVAKVLKSKITAAGAQPGYIEAMVIIGGDRLTMPTTVVDNGVVKIRLTRDISGPIPPDGSRIPLGKVRQILAAVGVEEHRLPSDEALRAEGFVDRPASRPKTSAASVVRKVVAPALRPSNVIPGPWRHPSTPTPTPAPSVRPSYSGSSHRPIDGREMLREAREQREAKQRAAREAAAQAARSEQEQAEQEARDQAAAARKAWKARTRLGRLLLTGNVDAVTIPAMPWLCVLPVTVVAYGYMLFAPDPWGESSFVGNTLTAGFLFVVLTFLAGIPIAIAAFLRVVLAGERATRLDFVVPMGLPFYMAYTTRDESSWGFSTWVDGVALLGVWVVLGVAITWLLYGLDTWLGKEPVEPDSADAPDVDPIAEVRPLRADQ